MLKSIYGKEFSWVCKVYLMCWPQASLYTVPKEGKNTDYRSHILVTSFSHLRTTVNLGLR